MEKKILLLFIFAGLVATGFLVVYMLPSPRSILDPLLAGMIGTEDRGNLAGDIQHCRLNSDAIVNQEILKGSSSVKAEDDNIRLALYVDRANTTEFEDQNFFLEVYNKVKQPLVFPGVTGEPYTITGYGKTGSVLFTLGGEYPDYVGFNGWSSSMPKRPPCFIEQGESATFDTSTRIGTKDHNSTTIAYAAASVKYMIDGKEKTLQTLGDQARNYNTSNSLLIDIAHPPDGLLGLVVSPVSLPKLDSYFDVALAMPYPPRLGEERPLYVVARSQYYAGPYTINLRVPEGLQMVSGRTEIKGEFPSKSYIDQSGKPVSPVVEQPPVIIRIKPREAGNYTTQATIYSTLNSSRVGNTDIIWLSVAHNGTSSVSRTEQPPNSILPLAEPEPSKIIQDGDPVPRLRIAQLSNTREKAVYHDPVTVDFS
jgi:hypothetical protein